MAICTFFQQGRCRYGDRCSNEHPKTQGQFGQNTGNRFGVLQVGGSKPPGNGFGASKQDQRDKYSLDARDIKHDLTDGHGRPKWIFSAYGPGRNAPVQLFGGPEREQSFEEMRVLHYAAVAEGRPQEAIQNANNLYAAAEAQMKHIINNVEEAIKYVLDGENQHPNRFDIINGKSETSASAGSQQNPFLQPPQGPIQPSPFSTSGTTQPTIGLGTGGFGQPTALGQQQPQRAAFGAPSFGQPSGLGQPSALGTSPFSQAVTSTQPQSNPFGQQTANPFAQAAQTTNPFGPAPSNPAGQPQSSPFASLQTQAQPQQGSTGSNPFSSVEPPKGPKSSVPTPFGQPSVLNATVPPTGPKSSVPTSFGRPSVPNAAPTPAQPQLPSPTPTSGIPQAKKANPNLNPFPKMAGQTVHNPMTKKLTMWKGRPVQYIDNDPCYQHPDDPQSYVHIFFPDGPPKPDTFKHSSAPPEEYTPEVEQAYRYAHEHGEFKGNLLPSVPPKPEWARYDI